MSNQLPVVQVQHKHFNAQSLKIETVWSSLAPLPLTTKVGAVPANFFFSL